MTAYLQPGDKVIMAFGTDVNEPKSRQVEQARENGKFWENAFKAIGVELTNWTASSGLQAPAIIAVVRNPDKS